MKMPAAFGIKAGDRVVAVDGAQLDRNRALAADLRVGSHEVNHSPLTLTIERSKCPRPQLGGLSPELGNLHVAGKLVLLHKGTDGEFRKILDDLGAATIDQVALRPIFIGSSHGRCICRCHPGASTLRGVVAALYR